MLKIYPFTVEYSADLWAKRQSWILKLSLTVIIPAAFLQRCSAVYRDYLQYSEPPGILCRCSTLFFQKGTHTFILGLTLCRITDVVLSVPREQVKKVFFRMINSRARWLIQFKGQISVRFTRRRKILLVFFCFFLIISAPSVSEKCLPFWPKM